MNPVCKQCQRVLWRATCSVCRDDQPMCSYCAWKNTAYQRCRKCQVEWAFSETETEEEFRLLILDQREIRRTASNLGVCKTCATRHWLAPCNMCGKSSVICPTCAFRGGKDERCPKCHIDWTYSVCKTVVQFRLSILSAYKPEPVKAKEECRKSVPVKKPTNSEHCAFGIEQDEKFVRLPNDEATKPSRVKAPGGKKNTYRGIESIEKVPEIYKTDIKRFNDLAYDPDQKAPNPREAMTGLAAEKQHLITPPIIRAGKGLEFYDANGIPYDVKAPLSPPLGEDWKFNAESASKTVIEQLTVKVKNANSQEIQHVRVLLDTTYLDELDHIALWLELKKRATDNPEMLNLIIELNVELD